MMRIGTYRLLELLGEGTYGKVYKAAHNETEQLVAIKVINHNKFDQNPQLQDYTINEINILTELRQAQGIARYIDVQKSAHNYYFIYEYCNGGTLKKLIDTYKTKPQKTMPLQQALTYFGQILNAFKLLTKNKTMHRDIKPANILLHDGRIKIADFGLSKCLKSPTDVADTMVGSPLYMSPEILKGESYTMKADIWSLGVVLYEMIFGACPFESKDICKLLKVHRTHEVKFPKTIPVKVENLLRRILVKEPSKRIDWSGLFGYKIVGGELFQPEPVSYKKEWVPKSQYTPESQQPTNPRANMLIPSQPRHQSINYPTQQSKTKIKEYLQSHQEVIRVSQLSLNVLKQSPKQSIYLSYIISKKVQQWLNKILDSLNKLSPITKPYNSPPESKTAVTTLKQTIVGELGDLKGWLRMCKQIIESQNEDVNKIQLKKYRILRSFYKSMKNREEGIVMVAQIIDLFSESIVVKKEIYKKANPEELVKHIDTKLVELGSSQVDQFYV